jgi:hypothetical protein
MIRGTYVFYQDGKEICRSSNVITKFGKRFLTNFIAGSAGGSGVVIIRSLVDGATTGSNVLVTGTTLNGDAATEYKFYSSGTITF